MYKRPLTATIFFISLLTGCSDNFAQNYHETDRPIILGCSGAIQMPLYAPEALRASPEAFASTDWYARVFDQSVPRNVLDYIQLPDYQTQAPAYLQQRPIVGNTMPYESHSLSFYYVDAEGGLMPMDLYFERYDTPVEQNARAGSLRYDYRFWAVAPASAEYIGLKLSDNPIKWRYAQNSDVQIDQVDELWFGRQADSYARAQWTRDAYKVGPTDQTPLTSFALSEDATCRASPYFNSTRDPLSLKGFEDDNWQRRDEYRAALSRIQNQWLKYDIGRSPALLAPDYIVGTTTKSKGDNHFFPLVGLSEDDFVKRVRAGQLDGSWDADRWRAPLNLADKL